MQDWTADAFQRPLWPKGLRHFSHTRGNFYGFNGLYGLRGCDVSSRFLKALLCFNGLYGLRGCDSMIDKMRGLLEFQRPLWPEGLRLIFGILLTAVIVFQRPLWPEGLRREKNHGTRNLFQRPLWPEGLRPEERLLNIMSRGYNGIEGMRGW